MTVNLTKNIDVSRETIERLELFQDQLIKWNRSINLVSRSTIDQFWDRHVVDSAQLLSFCDHPAKKWVDLGSGGGLPGIVISTILKERSPSTKIVLIESDRRKSSFLLQMKVMLKLNIDVLPKRILDVSCQQTEFVSARALAPLNDLLGFMKHHGHADSIGVFPKGRTYMEEIENAKRRWEFDWEAYTSETDPEAKILKVTNLKYD